MPRSVTESASSLFTSEFRSHPDRVLNLALVLFCVTFMIPRLASPQLGLLDDAVTVMAARSVLASPDQLWRIDAGTGRFRPAYWLFYTLIYALGWDSPLFFFIMNTLVLCACVLFLASVLRRLGLPPWPTFLSCGFFITSTIVVENFYTLSKAEPVQLLFVALAVYLAARTAEAACLRRRALAFLLITAALAASMLTKETGVAMVLFASLAAIVSWPMKTAESGRKAWRISIFLLLTSLVAGLVFLLSLLAQGRTGLTEGSYTRQYVLAPSRFVSSLAILTVQILHGIPYLPVLVLCLGYLVLRRRLQWPRPLNYAIVWMACWGTALLPWPHPLAYHLLVLHLGAAVFAGTAFHYLVEETNPPRPRSYPVMALLVGGSLVVAWLNAFTAGRNQLLIDQANAELVDFLAGLPTGSKVYVDLPQFNEYVFEINAHLHDLQARRDIEIRYLQAPEALGDAADTRTYWVLPFLRTQLFPSVRCAVNEPDARARNERARKLADQGWETLWQVRRRLVPVDIGLYRLTCPVLGTAGSFYCTAPRPLIETRESVYGWTILHWSKSAQRIH
jgi:hypothetical protein